MTLGSLMDKRISLSIAFSAKGFIVSGKKKREAMKMPETMTITEKVFIADIPTSPQYL
jgi:hypothetical protein